MAATGCLGDCISPEDAGVIEAIVIADAAEEAARREQQPAMSVEGNTFEH